MGKRSLPPYMPLTAWDLCIRVRYWDDALNLAGVVASLAHLVRLSLTAKAFWQSYRRAVALCYAGGGLPFLTVSNESIHASPLGVS